MHWCIPQEVLGPLLGPLVFGYIQNQCHRCTLNVPVQWPCAGVEQGKVSSF